MLCAFQNINFEAINIDLYKIQPIQVLFVNPLIKLDGGCAMQGIVSALVYGMDRLPWLWGRKRPTGWNSFGLLFVGFGHEQGLHRNDP